MNINTVRVENYKIKSAIKPNLLKHSREYRTLATLRYLFPDDYNEMTCGETPDLQDNKNGVGIEVTEAVAQNDMEAYRLSSNYFDNTNKRPEQLERLKRRIKECGYDINEDNHSINRTGTSDGDKYYFQESIRKKLKKLPIYKSKFKKIGLAVVLSDIYSSCLGIECGEQINDVIREYDCSFDFIYVIYNYFCCYYDSHTKSFFKIYLSKKDSESLRKIARMTAEGKISLNDLEWQEKQ